MSLTNPQALDSFTWWRRLFTLVICTIAMIFLSIRMVPVYLNTLPWLIFYAAVFVPAWVVAASYEAQYLYKRRKFKFQIAYWDGYCPYCDNAFRQYHFAEEPQPGDSYHIVQCTCARDLVIHTDCDGHHHLL